MLPGNAEDRTWNRSRVRADVGLSKAEGETVVPYIAKSIADLKGEELMVRVKVEMASLGHSIGSFCWFL